MKEHFKKNNFKLELDKFMEELYSEDENFFYQKSEDKFQTNHVTSSLIKLTISKLLQEENISILDYICRNIEEIKEVGNEFIV